METLRVSKALRAVHGGRDPNVYDILAVHAIQHGLESTKVLQLATKMFSTDANHKNRVSWEGSPIHIYNALRAKTPSGKKLVPEIEKLLLESRDRPLDSPQICERLGLEWNQKNQHNVNSALQLLDSMQLVRKMPMHSARSPVSVWMHNAHANPRTNHPNSSMELLEALAQENDYAPLTRYYREKIFVDKKRSKKYYSGNPQARFTNGTMYVLLSTLTKSGLIETRKTISPEKANLSFLEVRLSPYGRRLLEAYARTGHLPEALRKLLVGEKEHKSLAEQIPVGYDFQI